jgi:hypothetical protein
MSDWHGTRHAADLLSGRIEAERSPLLQGVCEPSRRMFPLRARATRVRGEHQLFRASKDSPLAAGDETTKLLRPQACSEFGRAVERMRREEPRRRILLADGREDGRGGCGGQIASTARPPRPMLVAVGVREMTPSAGNIPIACLPSLLSGALDIRYPIHKSFKSY